MDSNGTRHLALNRAADFATASHECAWNAAVGAFTLARGDSPRLPRLMPERARELLKGAPPWIVDDFGFFGTLSDAGARFEWRALPSAPGSPVRASAEGERGGSAEALELDPVDPPQGCRFTDLHIGGSGVVALPYGGAENGVVAIHLKHRWQARCALRFPVSRAWVDRQEQIWVAGDGSFGVCAGAPLPAPYRPRRDRFEPLQLNPDPLRLLWEGHDLLPPYAELLALAAADDRLVLLVRQEACRQELLVRPLLPERDVGWSVYRIPADLPFATDIACDGDGRVLLLLPFEEGAARGRNVDCAMLQLDTAEPVGDRGARLASLARERWPRRSEQAVRFVRHRDNAIRILTEDGVQRLHRLPQARYPQRGEAELAKALDSGTPGTVWSRLYLEGCIPQGCRLEVAALASDLWPPAAKEWQCQPAPGWVPIHSEIPFAPAPFEPREERQGLFEVLLQREKGAVRDLAGRYLRLRLTMSGDGRHTPALCAVRAWFPRFSWQEHYLPPHFHQQESPLPDAPEGTPGNGADLRERLLACLEGVLTPLEDTIAAAETLLDPDRTPAGYLPWLADMTAAPLPPHWPEARLRRWLGVQGELQRSKGSYGALVLGLDIATDGAVGRGEVVPVELFRLRRTFATILGISMDDARHPLTLGTGLSGNSIVGESLILSDAEAREFLALLAPELASAEQEAVAAFFERYARRVTIILNGPGRSLRQTVAAALPGLVPAAVSWKIVESEHPFVLGLAPLLRIDTYLERAPRPGRVRLDSSILGGGDLVQNPVALAPEALLGRDA